MADVEAGRPKPKWKGEVPYPDGETAEGYPWIGATEPKIMGRQFRLHSFPFVVAAARAAAFR
jgi:hypothetical protein